MTTVATRSTPATASTCAHCGDPIPFVLASRSPRECDDCAEWFNSTHAEDFHEPDYGGAFDGFTVTSDADPGL